MSHKTKHQCIRQLVREKRSNVVVTCSRFWQEAMHFSIASDLNNSAVSCCYGPTIKAKKFFRFSSIAAVWVFYSFAYLCKCSAFCHLLDTHRDKKALPWHFTCSIDALKVIGTPSCCSHIKRILTMFTSHICDLLISTFNHFFQRSLLERIKKPHR